MLYLRMCIMNESETLTNSKNEKNEKVIDLLRGQHQLAVWCGDTFIDLLSKSFKFVQFFLKNLR